MNALRLFTFRMLFVALCMGLLGASVCGQAHVTKEPVANDGTPVQLDLPRALHLKNTGGSDGPRGPGSGSGLCVFTSLNHASYWNRVPLLYDFQKYMTQFPGGGWPQKVDAMIARKAAAASTDKPEYVQFEANNLDLLALAVKTGRMPSITYSYSPTKRYGGAKIAHMVSLVGARAGKGPDGKGWWTVLDNNFPGTYEWMPESEFLRVYSGGRLGWSVVFLNPSPPPVPVN